MWQSGLFLVADTLEINCTPNNFQRRQSLDETPADTAPHPDNTTRWTMAATKTRLKIRFDCNCIPLPEKRFYKQTKQFSSGEISGMPMKIHLLCA